MKWVRAFAPATVANVCCGFDILGFAIDGHGDEVEVRLSDTPGVRMTKITGDDGKLPMETNRNTSSVAVQSYLNALGKDTGVEVELYKNLPLGSGMGSSAASAAAALIAVNTLMGEPMNRKELVPHAMEAERIACGTGHADNVAPSILGGFVLIRDYHPLDLLEVRFPKELCCVLVHPHLEVKTEDSRRILRNSVTIRDAVSQSANAAGLMIGLMTSDFVLIGKSLKDAIAEPVRSVFIPGFDQLKQVAKDAGALGAGISGSGPTVFALCNDINIAKNVGQNMVEHFSLSHLKSDVIISPVNSEGARVISKG
ncbi:MAG TPA: homoserine kinase [Cyclobacteriaceae bacterium]|nr:homoserine kinase [Cyclobacteriaceae bacterium]